VKQHDIATIRGASTTEKVSGGQSNKACGGDQRNLIAFRKPKKKEANPKKKE